MNNQSPSIRLNLMPDINEMQHLVQICNLLSTAKFYEKLGPGGVLAIYLTAREMNLPVMFCLNGGLHNIEGKVVLSGQLINMMLTNAGWDLDFPQMDKEACKIIFTSPKGKILDFKYTIEEAREAGYFGIQGPNGTMLKKPKDNWIYHTKDMLFNRCIASGGRKFAPTVLGNCYAIGELDAEESLSKNTHYHKDNVKIAEKLQKIEINSINLQELQIFKDEYQINEGTEVYEYISKIAEKKNLNIEKAIELAFKNKANFLKAFESMKAKKENQESV